MKTHNKLQTEYQTGSAKNLEKPQEITAEELEEIIEVCGLPVPDRTNEEWIQVLRQRLARQKRDFSTLLDLAAEKPELVECCHPFRQKIQATRQKLADYRSLRRRLN